MSQHLEQITKVDKPSHDESDSKSEEGSTASEEDMLLSIQYPSPPYFPTPYLHNWDFRDSNQALKYITKHSNCETIHNSLWKFPDLSPDFIYSRIQVIFHYLNVI